MNKLFSDELQEAVHKREISKRAATKLSKHPKEKQREIIESMRKQKDKKLHKNEAATVRRSTRGLTDIEKDAGFANYIFDGNRFLVSPLYSELENRDRGKLRMAGSETNESRTLCKDWDVYYDSKIREKIIKAIEPLLSFEVHALWQGKKPAFTITRNFNRAKDRRRIVDMICADLEHMTLVLEQMEARRVEKGLDPQVPPEDMVPRLQQSKEKKPPNGGYTVGSMAFKLLSAFNGELLTVSEAAQRALPNEAWNKLKTATARGTELLKIKFIEDTGERRNGAAICRITEAGKRAIGR